MPSPSLKKMGNSKARKEGNYASSDNSPTGRSPTYDLGLTLLPGSQIEIKGDVHLKTAAWPAKNKSVHSEGSKKQGVKGVAEDQSKYTQLRRNTPSFTLPLQRKSHVSSHTCTTRCTDLQFCPCPRESEGVRRNDFLEERVFLQDGVDAQYIGAGPGSDVNSSEMCDEGTARENTFEDSCSVLADTGTLRSSADAGRVNHRARSGVIESGESLVNMKNCTYPPANRKVPIRRQFSHQPSDSQPPQLRNCSVTISRGTSLLHSLNDSVIDARSNAPESARVSQAIDPLSTQSNATQQLSLLTDLAHNSRRTLRDHPKLASPLLAGDATFGSLDNHSQGSQTPTSSSGEKDIRAAPSCSPDSSSNQVGNSSNLCRDLRLDSLNPKVNVIGDFSIPKRAKRRTPTVRLKSISQRLSSNRAADFASVNTHFVNTDSLCYSSRELAASIGYLQNNAFIRPISANTAASSTSLSDSIYCPRLQPPRKRSVSCPELRPAYFLGSRLNSSGASMDSFQDWSAHSRVYPDAPSGNMSQASFQSFPVMAPSTSRVPPSQGDQQYSAPPFASTPSFALSTIDSSNIHYNINNPGFWGQTTPGHRQHHDHSQNLPDNYHRHQNFQNPVEDRRIQVNEAKRQLLPPAATGHHPTTVSQPWASSHVRNVSSGLSSHQNSGQSIYRTPYQPVVTPPNSQVSTSPPSTVPAPPESASMTLLSAPTIQNTQANNLRNTFRNEFRERVFQIGDQISKRLQNKNIIPRVLAFVQSFPKSGEPFDRLPSDEHFFKAIKGAESVIAARDTRIKILIKEVDDHKALAGRWGMKDPTSGKTRLQELAERTSYLERTLLQREAELAAKVKEATHLQQKCQHLIGLLEKRMPGTTSTAAILDTKLQNHGISPMSRTLDPISIDLTSDEASTPASAAISNNNSASLSRGSSSEGSISKVVEFHNQLKRKSLNWLEGGHPLKTRLNPYARPRKGRYSSTTIDLDAQPLDEDALMEGNGTSPSGEISLDTLNSNTERDEREKQKKLERARKNKESREKSKLKKRQEAEKRDAAKSAEVEAEAEAERVRKQQEEAENAAKAERFRKEQEDALRRKQQNKIIRDQRVAKEKHRRAEEEDQKQKERLERQRKNAFLAGQNQLEEPKPVVMEEADDDSMRDLFEDDDDSPELYHTDVDAPATETQEMAKAIFDPEAESNKQRQILEDEHLFGESTKTNDETVIQMDENVQRNAHADESENFGDGDDGSSDDDDGFDEDSTAEVPNTSQEDDDSDAEFDAEFDAEISKLLQAGSLAAEEIADQDVGQQATSGVAGDDSSEESEAE